MRFKDRVNEIPIVWLKIFTLQCLPLCIYRVTVPSYSHLPVFHGTTGVYSDGLGVPFDDDGLSVTSTENGDISSSYRPENLPYGKDMLVSMNLNGKLFLIVEQNMCLILKNKIKKEMTVTSH